jgi:hypothetical protein
MIYIIITTSIHNKDGIINEEHRKERYIDSISNCLNIVNNRPTHDSQQYLDIFPSYELDQIKIIVVENNGSRYTYLNTLDCDIIYTNNNSIRTFHKGVNELLDIKQVIQEYSIKDDDMIIKLTGRYKLLNDSFLNIVKNNINTHDAFIKFFNVCTLEYMRDDCILGIFAIRCKYLKQFEYKGQKSPECEFAEFVRSTIHDRIFEIKNLNLECCFAGDLRILYV